MNRVLCKLSSIAVLLMAVTSTAVAQHRFQSQVNPQLSETPPVQADELFVLDIKERRISEKDFEASTAVAAGADSQKGVRVQAGVLVQAQTIDVLLRNVKASVRFRGSLQRILDILNSHPR